MAKKIAAYGLIFVGALGVSYIGVQYYLEHTTSGQELRTAFHQAYDQEFQAKFVEGCTQGIHQQLAKSGQPAPTPEQGATYQEFCKCLHTQLTSTGVFQASEEKSQEFMRSPAGQKVQADCQKKVGLAKK